MTRRAVSVVTDAGRERAHRSPKHAARDALEMATAGALGVDPLGFLVLFKLVGRLNHRNSRTSAWPSQQLLVADTGIALRTLKRVLARLEASGLMKIHRNASRGQPNEYVIDVDELCRRACVSGASGPVQRQLGPMLGEVQP